MPDNRNLDSLEFSSLNFPYNKVLRELDETPRIVAGENSYITYGGKISKRPGTLALTNGAFNKRIDRVWFYETLDNPVVIYVVASAYDSGTAKWGLHYIRLDTGSPPTWTSLGSYRDINASTRPHQAVTSRGLLYVKGYPASGSSEKLGTVIVDGTAGSVSVKPWGMLGPTTPARISGILKSLSATITESSTSFTFNNVTSLPATPFNVQIDYEVITVVTLVGSAATVILRGAQGTVPSDHEAGSAIIYRDWTASAHPVAVNMFWAYTYAYKSITGHISNRAPLETNPDNLPSQTGPFTNLIPKITVQGLADTTNFPTIVIYRVTDGGGTFMKLSEIANTGAGNITYSDNTRASTAGNADPIRDSDLNSQSLAPSLNSNSPPTTVLAPSVTGTDTPVASTTLVAFQGRIWQGIGNTLFYSSKEELNTGIGEEAWPTGLYGNFFTFPNPIVMLEETADVLYVITTQAVYKISGTTRTTFNPKHVINNVGGSFEHPQAITKFGDTLVWLTHDLRIGILQGNNFRTIHEPLGLDYRDQINAGAEIAIKYWAELDKEWLVLGAIRSDSSTNTRIWVYDIKKSTETKSDFWNTPWSIPTTILASGRPMVSSTARRLLFFNWITASSLGILTILATWTAVDDLPVSSGSASTTSSTYGCLLDTNLFMTPPGNHIHTLRRPGLIPVVHSMILDRTIYASDTEPDVYYFLNDIWTNAIPTVPSHTPTADDSSLGYKTMVFDIHQNAKRIAFRIRKPASSEFFDIQNFAISWHGDAGVAL